MISAVPRPERSSYAFLRICEGLGLEIEELGVTSIELHQLGMRPQFADRPFLDDGYLVSAACRAETMRDVDGSAEKDGRR